MIASAELLTIVPSRGRPANAERLRTAYFRTASGMMPLFGCDLDDPTLPGYEKAGLSMRVGPREGLCGTLNTIAVDHADRFWALGFMGDDHLPRTPDWDRHVLDQLEELGTGIVYCNDLFQGRNLPTAVFMTSDIVRALGYMAPPCLRHMFADNAWRDWGHAAGCLRYLPDVIIEHMHPEAGKAEVDSGYHEVWPLMAADNAAYEEYEQSGRLAADVERIRGAASTPVR